MNLKEGDESLLATKQDSVKLNPPSTIDSFEDILRVILPLSWWQAWIYCLFSYLEFFLAFINLSVIFYQITPDHTCAIPGRADSLWTLEQARNVSSPIISSDGSYDSCEIFDFNYTALANLTYESALAFREETLRATNITTSKCHSWIYDRTYMKETVVTQWDIVCDNQWWVEHGTMVNYFGMLVGSFVGGLLSDRFGRRTAFIFFVLLYAVFGTIISFSPNYWWFIPIRFLIQVGRMGSSLSIFCYALEITSSRYRVWIGGLFFLPYALGYAALAGVAYLLPNWRLLHIAISVPSLIVVFYYWLIPESPRWLIAEKKFTEADRILRRAAKVNGRVLPDNIDYKQVANNLNKAQIQANGSRVNFFHIFQYKVLAFRAVVLYYIWEVLLKLFVNAMVYYGLSLNVSSFDGNIFVNNAIAGLVEIPGFFLCTVLLSYGRKPANYACLILCGITLIAVPWIPADMAWLKLILVMCGKLGITASFSAIYVITAELYPTVVHNSGLATSSALGRIGSMLAPYISGLSKLGKSYEWLPMIVFGSFALSAGLFTFLLPETEGKKLPEQLEDALVFVKESSVNTREQEELNVLNITTATRDPEA